MERINNTIDRSVQARVNHFQSAPETLRRLKELDERIENHEKLENAHWEAVRNDIKELKEVIEGASDGLAVLNNLLATRRVLGWTAGLIVVVASIIGGMLSIGAAIKAFIKL